MKSRVLASCLGIAVFAVFALAQDEQAPRVKGYTLTIVGPLPGKTNAFLPAYASVNESHRAVGYSWHLSDPPASTDLYLNAVPFEWRDGMLTPMELLPGWPGAMAFSMNNRGDAIGVANKLESDRIYQTPVLWPTIGGMPVSLGLLPGDLVGSASGINSRGQIVGSSSGPTGPHPVIWQKGEISELSYPDAYPGNVGMGQTSTINDKGEIVGVTGLTNPGPFEATMWDNQGHAYHLGTLPGDAPLSQAYSINNQGQVVGYSVTKYTGGITRAFLWEKGMMQDLGTLGGLHSTAFAINNSTQVVGVARTPQGIQHAFVWEDGQMFDLNDLIPPESGMVLVRALAINHRGYISGLGTMGGNTLGFLLTPEP